MGKQDLYISIPSFFRCPISLDIMKSPVSLSTGVTYDRTSIQRWLENGNNTCPATMQVLDSKDFVPNHTLQRLIQIWYNNNNNNHNHLSQSSKSKPPQFHSLSANQIADLIKQLLGGQIIKKRVLFESFVKILCFATESAENRRFLASNQPFLDHLLFTVSGSDPDLLEAVLKTLHLVIASRDVNLSHVRQKMGSSSFDFLQTLVRILRTGRPGSRVAAIGIIEELRRHPESKKAVFDHQELIPELLELVKCGKLEKDGEIQAVLSCLISLSSTRTNKLKLVRAEGVKLVGDILSSYQTTNNNNSDNSKNVIVMIELLLTLLEMLAGCTEGRTAISENPNCVPMIINKLMKVSKAANEHGIALLWSMCYLFRDQKARDSVVNSNSGLTKILLLMQSDCSPAVKQMCCDLLRIFKVNSKSCLSSYETKTTHIMPC